MHPEICLFLVDFSIFRIVLNGWLEGIALRLLIEWELYFVLSWDQKPLLKWKENHQLLLFLSVGHLRSNLIIYLYNFNIHHCLIRGCGSVFLLQEILFVFLLSLFYIKSIWNLEEALLYMPQINKHTKGFDSLLTYNFTLSNIVFAFQCAMLLSKVWITVFILSGDHIKLIFLLKLLCIF